MQQQKQITIGCVGMTHLGINYATAFAEKGFSLVCYDRDPVLIKQLSQGQLPVSEPGLEALITRNQAKLHFSSDIHVLKACDVVFVAYDVPTDDQGISDLEVIRELLVAVINVLSESACLVLLSQVTPGFTQQIAFDKTRLFYQVETLIFGRAVERALYPERYIVGMLDPQNDLPAAYQQLLDSFDCPILKMRYESAELAKIAINMYLVSTVSTTNTLAEMCEAIGANWEEIAPALRLDKRIGPYAYLNPGLGIAGGNLERDLATIRQLGNEHGTNTQVVASWVTHSQYCRDWVLRCLQKNVFTQLKNPTIAVLGLAYKPGTHSIKNSQSMHLLTQLPDCTLQLHDPVVKIDHPGYCATVIEAVTNADVIVIMTPWDEYKTLEVASLLRQMRGTIIIDPYHALQGANHPKINYFIIGQMPIMSQEDTCLVT